MSALSPQSLAEARLRAKAKQQERDRLAREQSDSTSAAQRVLAKRPLQAVPADSTSPTAPQTRSFPAQPFASGSGSVRDASSRLHRVTASPAPTASTSTDTGVSTRSKSVGANALPRDARLGTYIEVRSSPIAVLTRQYDLSTLKNSKGGFLISDEGDDEYAAKLRQIAEDLRKERMREAERQGLDGQQDPMLGLRSGEDAPRCEICKSLELDLSIFKTYGVAVCPKDRNDHPDRYSLLTKTECKEDYLLTDRARRFPPNELTRQPNSKTPSCCRTCSRKTRIDRRTAT